MKIITNDRKLKICSVAILLALPSLVFSQIPLLDASIADRELDRNQKQLQAKIQELQQKKLVLDSKQPVIATQFYDNERPCFIISKIELEEPITTHAQFRKSLKSLQQGKNNILGKCLGEKSLNHAKNILQNEIIDQGFITSRVSIKNQDLSTGKLVFTIYPGKVNKIIKHQSNTDKINTNLNIVSRANKVLNLRDIETSLENLRLPQSVTTNIEIQPAQSSNHKDDNLFGYSDLVIKYRENKPFHVNASIDNLGNETTGKYQGYIGITIDNPLNASDILKLQYNHAIDPWNNTGIGASNDSFYVDYVVPIRNMQLNLNYDQYNYYQMLLGFNDNLKYEGKTKRGKIDFNWLIHRTKDSRTNANFSTYYKESKNYVDGLEVLIQGRKQAGWNVGLTHQQNLKKGSLNLGVNYKQGTDWFSATASPESEVGLATDFPSVTTLNIVYNRPFLWNDGYFNYSITGIGQWTNKELISQDQFTIGDGATVRGFSGKQALSGNKGFALSQELTWYLPDNNSRLYLGIDGG